MSIFSYILNVNVVYINFFWPSNPTVTDVPRQMSLYRFPGFILLSYLFLQIIVTEIVPYLYIQNKIIRIRICIRIRIRIRIRMCQSDNHNNTEPECDDSKLPYHKTCNVN